jgi:hypothetical protein
VFVNGPNSPQLDATVWKPCGYLAQQQAKTRLKSRLRHWVCLNVAWARLEEVCTELS